MAAGDQAGTGSAAERDRFLAGTSASPDVRQLVAESWQRSVAAGLDPDAHLAPVVLADSDLHDYRAAHPLAQIFPLLYDVLGRAAEDCDCVMAVGDADGRRGRVSGTSAILRRAEAINFVEGSAWAEGQAGTNAPAMALLHDTAVQIRAAEHFNRLVQPWSCAAAPIHDPLTQQVLGLVDITGGDDVASPQTLGLIRAAARMAESELARIAAVDAHGQLRRAAGSLWSPVEARSRALLTVRALGRPECVASMSNRSYRLSRRHSDILVVLLDHPEGLTAEQLEIEVYAADVHSSTMRAEMTRLRALLGPAILQSRPYRITADIDCDWHNVAAELADGRVRDAVRSYQGPLLPQSEAPGVRERRDRLERQLRAAILASGQPDLMVNWTRTRWGADDLEMWQQQCRALPAGSPLLPLAAAEAGRLERELADPGR
ncbi:MAG: GAF domain-containing protein [Jatrophihabitantaceae bacterium]